MCDENFSKPVLTYYLSLNTKSPDNETINSLHSKLFNWSNLQRLHNYKEVIYWDNSPVFRFGSSYFLYENVHGLAMDPSLYPSINIYIYICIYISTIYSNNLLTIDRLFTDDISNAIYYDKLETD